MIDKFLNFFDDSIPKNDFDRQLLASNLVSNKFNKIKQKRKNNNFTSH